MSIRLNELRTKRGGVHDKMETILAKAKDEDRDLDEAEDQAFNELDTEYESLGKAIAREERVLAIKGESAKPVHTHGNNEHRTVPAQPRHRYNKLKAFRGANAEEAAYRSGMFARAVVYGDAAAAEWCREHDVPLTRANNDFMPVARAAGESSNTIGGFLVPPEFSQVIIDLREEYGTFRGECRVMPMGSDSLSIPRRTGGLTAYFVNENSQITESDKGWGQVQLQAKKLAALSRMSTELADDAIIDVAEDLAQEMAYAFVKTEDSCGWNGDGTSTYGAMTGVRTKIIDGTHTAGAVNAASGHDTFGEIDTTDLSNLMGALPKYAERNAKWYCSQPAWAVVFQRLIAAAGGVTMGELTGGKPTRSYLGYPVVIDQTLPTSTGSLNNAAMLFFGDLSLACTFGERRGIMIARSDQRYFENDQIAVRATERFDINVHDLGDNTTAGPVVGLIGH